MKVGVIGSGDVGKALAKGFAKHGYEVMIASRTPEKLKEFAEEAKVKTGNDSEAAKFGEMIVLCVRGSEAENAIALAGIENLNGKTIIDTTNPIDTSKQPDNGVLHYFTTLEESLHERLQKQAPEANFVKAFNSVGNAFMVNPEFGEKPTMFICGNNDGAKKEVGKVLDKFGWETGDMGKMEAARAIEPLCILWCIPGFTRNEWSHAFRLLKK